MVSVKKVVQLLLGELVRGITLPNQRLVGGVAPPQRTGSAFGRPDAGPIKRLCAPATRCHARRVVRLVGGRGWPEREPSHTGPSGAGAGLAAKKKSVHAAERDTERDTARYRARYRAIPSAIPSAIPRDTARDTERDTERVRALRAALPKSCKPKISPVSNSWMRRAPT